MGSEFMSRSAYVSVFRGDLRESVHRMHVAVTDGTGALLAWAGDPDRVTPVRSVAKPFQALAWVREGVVDRFGLEDDAIAVACASHGGTPRHLRAVRTILRKANVAEAALSCGPHAPLDEEAAGVLARQGIPASRIHNNCSGKHAGMLALARSKGWPLEGYGAQDHPVQQRVLAEFADWTGLAPSGIAQVGDGCGVPSFVAPLASIATAYARLGEAGRDGGVGGEVLAAMIRHPFLLAGRGRLCTRLLEATRGAVVAKVGAEGVYGAVHVPTATGMALKVEDGARRAAEVGLLHVLLESGWLTDRAQGELAQWVRPGIPDTRGRSVGYLEADFRLETGTPGA